MKNADITVYTKSYDKATRLDKWTKSHYYDVVFTGGKGASLNKGIIEANDVKIRVRATENNFKVGDVVIKGIGADINVLTDLTNYYTINSVVDNSYYSTNPHIHLGAK